MATKESFVEEVSKLPGVGKRAAEKLFDAGYSDVEKLKAATAAELQKVEGIGKKTADAIVKGLSELAGPAETKMEVREKGGEAQPEIVEPSAVYRAKLKPKLDEEMKRLLAIRAAKNAKQPYFGRYPSWHSRRLERSGWRAPKGPTTPQRKDYDERPPRVKIGYKKPVATRGLHSSGFEEVLVHNTADIAKLNPERQAARIAGGVGMRKRKDIVAAAEAKKIRILNPKGASQ
ncbi:MAG: 50S ribosomal protein L32e [Thermoplasmatota archaeon]